MKRNVLELTIGARINGHIVKGNRVDNDQVLLNSIADAVEQLYSKQNEADARLAEASQADALMDIIDPRD